MSSTRADWLAECPICSKHFKVQEIEAHANQCLNSQQVVEDEKLAQSIAVSNLLQIFCYST